MYTYMKTIKRVSLILLCLGIFVLTPRSIFASRFDLVAPSGELTRGQPVSFTVSIDTQGATVSTAQIGMTFDTQYLEYVSAVPGDAMSQISTNQTETGKLVMSGTSANGFSGNGTFATVTFNLIAQAPGSTELCTLFAPTETNPTRPPPANTTAAGPQPTRLPKTGENDSGNMIGLAGGMVVLLTGGVLFALNIQERTKQKHHIRAAHHKKKN